MESDELAQDASQRFPVPEWVAEAAGKDILTLDFDHEACPGIAGYVETPTYPSTEIVTADDDGSERAVSCPEIDFRAQESDLTDTGVLTHSIHKHPATFIPHIPRHIINTFTTQSNIDGERPVILDPFSGSGTTGIEAKIAGRDYLGVEINPLSKLVSEVSTTPIPYTLLHRVTKELSARIAATETRHYEDYDVDFLDQTSKTHWFEPEAIEGLTTIRKIVSKFLDDDFDWTRGLEPRERKVVALLDEGEAALRDRVSRWLVLTIASTVFDVSNADPDVSKAYKSQQMQDKIETEAHPPDATEIFSQHLDDSKARLIDFWNEIYGTHAPTGDEPNRAQSDSEPSEPIHQPPTEWIELDENRAHRAETHIQLGDARTFSFPEYEEAVDLAVTSPPYINAMNYYRGTKLRLFWVYDLLDEMTDIDAEKLRKSIIGTNSVGLSTVDRELPALVREEWTGSNREYQDTSLPVLDTHIQEIHHGELSEATSRAYVTWKFFAEDMLHTLAQTYQHLKPGAYFFFVVGENTIGGRRIQNHRFIADIAQNLGKFGNHHADLAEGEGYRLVGMAWDKITNRDLFRSRRHGHGVIEHEWVVILQKPSRNP